MTFSKIKSKHVCKDNELFIVHIGFGRYDIGVQVHKWGIRIMLIWWHIFIHK